MNTREKARQLWDALFPNAPQAEVNHPETSRAAVIVAAEYMNVPENKRGIKGTVPPPPKSKREECGYSRRDVVAILDKIEAHRLAKRDNPLLPERDTRSYRALAAGNETVEKLAHECSMSVGAFSVFVAGLEKTIIDEAAYLRKRFGVKIVENIVHVPDDAESDSACERIGDEARVADEKSIAASGGASIGGRIISRGKDSKGNLLALDTFERGGTLKQDMPSADEGSNASRDVEHDDYSEESSA
jgi:hypothetical protein